MDEPDAEHGCILDGFPRTLAQAKAFKERKGVDKVVLIDVSDKEALWRISGRVSDREDETLQAIRKRIALFHESTSAVVEYYKDRGMLITVDGEKEVEGVFKDIKKYIKK